MNRQLLASPVNVHSCCFWLVPVLSHLSIILIGVTPSWNKRIITDYLSGRTQVVFVGGLLSDASPVLSGVPPGSILGPLLFLVYNNLPSHVEGVSLFADDAALLQLNESLDRLRDSLQRGINEVHQWMTTWRLRPNIAKTEILFLPNSEPTPAFTIPGSLTDLTVVKQHKHLGLVIDSDCLLFSRHVDNICIKVSKAVGYLVSHCSHLPLECIRLFLSLLYSPHFSLLLNRLVILTTVSKSLMSTL